MASAKAPAPCVAKSVDTAGADPKKKAWYENYDPTSARSLPLPLRC